VRKLDLLEIAGGMQEPEQFDAILNGTVIEAVLLERIAAAIQDQFRTWTPQRVPLGEVVEFCPKPLDEAVCLQLAVFSDVISNLPDVRK